MYLRELKEQIEELMFDRLDEAISVNLKMLRKFDYYNVMPMSTYPEIAEKVGISKMTSGSYNLPLIHDKINVKWYLYDYPDKNIIPSNLKKQCRWNKKARTIEVYAASFNDYNNSMAKDVNEWLSGSSQSMSFVEKYSDSFDEEAVSPFCIIPIISYLKSKEII